MTMTLRDNVRESECSICLLEHGKETHIITLKSCSHVFHISCIRMWFATSKNTTCPLCRCKNQTPLYENIKESKKLKENKEIEKINTVKKIKNLQHT